MVNQKLIFMHMVKGNYRNSHFSEKPYSIYTRNIANPNGESEITSTVVLSLLYLNSSVFLAAINMHLFIIIYLF
jgi:hypothetical protein